MWSTQPSSAQRGARPGGTTRRPPPAFRGCLTGCVSWLSLLWEILGRSSSSDKGLPHGAGRPSHAVGTPFSEAVHSRRTRRNQRGGLPQHWGHRQQPCRWHPFTESSLWDWHRSEHSMSVLSRQPVLAAFWHSYNRDSDKSRTLPRVTVSVTAPGVPAAQGPLSWSSYVMFPPTTCVVLVATGTEVRCKERLPNSEQVLLP